MRIRWQPFDVISAIKTVLIESKTLMSDISILLFAGCFNGEWNIKDSHQII